MEWISVKDRLPESGQLIVGLAKQKHARISYWVENWDEDEPIGFMTHWLPLLNPPEA